MSSANESRLGYLLRTSVLSQLAGSIAWSVRWVKQDTKSTLSAWALGPSARPTSDSDGGLFADGSSGLTPPVLTWPTPMMGDAERGAESRESKAARGATGVNLRQVIAEAGSFPTPTAAEGPNRNTRSAPSHGTTRGMTLAGVLNDLQAASMPSPSMWASPAARDWKDTGPTQGAHKAPNLGTQAHAATAVPANWQTPTQMDCEQSGSLSRGHTLSNQAKATSNWSTPTATNSQGNQYTRDKGKKGAERPTLVGEIQVAGPTHPSSTPPGESSPRPSTTGNPSGSISAEWETALMGFPLGWLRISTSAASRLWATRKSPSV